VGGLLAGLPIILSRAQRTLGQIPEPEPEPAPVEAAAAGGIAAVSPSPVQPDA
jgi:hypothetical protein